MIRPTVCRACGATLATIQAGRFAPAEGVG